MKKGIFFFACLGLATLLLTSCNEKIASPPTTTTGTIKKANITIKYAQVGVKGRTIWGDLVPYGKIWRTGADSATVFEVDTDIMIQNKKLPAGKYGLFTIPEEGEWTIIFNEVWDQWGAFKYDESKDVLRVKAVPATIEEPMELLNFAVEGDHVVLRWESLKVGLKVTDMPASPPALTETTINGANITINYSQPGVKGRIVWDGLVPYGKVWRTGANAATTIEVSKNVKIQGADLPAGKYALFTIPTATEWTFIFNSNHEQWGAYDYKEDLDVLRVTATPESVAEAAERMTFSVDGNMINLAWEKVKVGFEVQ